MKQLFLAVAIGALGISVVACSGSTSTAPAPKYHLVPLTDTNPYGHPFHEWGERFVQWWVAMPQDHHPLWDRAPVDTNQTQPVWFLGTTLDTLSGNHPQITRSATIPIGTALFIGIAGFEIDTACGVPADSLTTILRHKWDGSNVSGTLTIDGDNISGLTFHLIDTTRFMLNIPESNVHGPAVHACTAPAALIGAYLMVDSLSHGSHSIHMRGGNVTFIADILYRLNVE